MSHRPGIRNLPRPSMTRAPLGTAVVAAGTFGDDAIAANYYGAVGP